MDKKTEEITHDDINPDSEILFTMNVDKQDFNIVVDKDTLEVKTSDAKNIEISESPVNTTDSQNIEIPTKAKKLEIEKLTDAEVLTQTEKPAEAKVITQSEKPTETVNKEETIDGNKEEIIKAIGQKSVERKVITKSSTSTTDF